VTPTNSCSLSVWMMRGQVRIQATALHEPIHGRPLRDVQGLVGEREKCPACQAGSCGCRGLRPGRPKRTLRRIRRPPANMRHQPVEHDGPGESSLTPR